MLSCLYSRLDNLVLSTWLIMGIGHRKEIRKLTFRALALRRSEFDEGLTVETSAPKANENTAIIHYKLFVS